MGLPLFTGHLEKQNIINIPILSLKKKKKKCLKCIFPEDFQCIPLCLKNSFPKNISLKHLTQWYCGYLALDVGKGLCPIVLVGMRPGPGEPAA